MADEVSYPAAIHRCLVVSRGAVLARTLSKSVVFANGNISDPKDERLRITQCVIFCDGDIVADRVIYSVVIATGSVKVKDSIEDSVIIQKERNPLKYLKLFDTIQMGVEVGEARTGVVVKSVAPGMPFARAGLRKGDLVAGVGTAKVTTPESFRKALRQHSVVFHEVVLKVRRGEKVHDVTVRLTP